MKTGSLIRTAVLASLSSIGAVSLSFAQTTERTTAPISPLAASAPTSVPALIPYSGVAFGANGKPLSGEVSATLLIYKDQQGGEPLLTESQNVVCDAAGHYEVQLGATMSNGIPIDLFASGEARWLAVEIAGEPAQPRILLASVPYALKAADAATLGGLPASAFALAPTKGLAAAAVITPEVTSTAGAPISTTTGGFSGYLPVFTGPTTISNSTIYQNADGIGINGIPYAALDVTGRTIFRGTMVVSRNGNATSAAGFGSVPLQFFANGWDSTINGPVQPVMQLQAEPSGNNTASPGATLNLLYSNGVTNAAETGLYFNANGTIHFAAGQTFPIISPGGGAVDGTSTSGVGVEGNSSSGAGVEGISNSGVGLAGNSTSNNGVQGTTGNAANTAGVYGVAGTSSGIGSGTVAGVWGDALNHVGVAGTSAAFPGVAGSSTSGYGVQGTSKSSSGVFGKSANVANTAGVYGVAATASGIGVGTIAGVWGDAMNHVGVVGTSALFPGVDGGSTSGSGVQGNSTTPNEGQAGVLGTNGTTVSGTRTTRATHQVAGVWGDTTGNPQTSAYAAGIIGTADNADGGSFFNNSGLFATVYAENTGNGNGVIGASDGTGIGVQGTGTTGVSGLSPVSSGAIGVLGVAGGRSTQGQAAIRSYFSVANWGDTNALNGYAIVGTADNGTAGAFFNNADTLPALEAYDVTDTTINPHSFAFIAGGSGGACTIDVTGNLRCAGNIGNVAQVESGARQVETYTVQSAENWLEDFGSGQLSNGVARINLEPTYAQTVNSGVEYHVFLTPKGDCKGLYVTNETAAGFDVREMGGGTSAIAFDYRIVAKRAGYENLRLTDVTEQIKQRAEPGTLNTPSHTPIPLLQPTLDTPAIKVAAGN
jgi:hypothetical protein